MSQSRLLLLFVMLCVAKPVLCDVPVELEMVHLRGDGPREWSTFPEEPTARNLERSFIAKRNTLPVFLRLRHQDVKQTWKVELNGAAIGRLRIDENDMIEYFSVPIEGLVDGLNKLAIRQDAKITAVTDDIRVGEVILGEKSLSDALNEARIRVEVTDEAGRALPARITIVNATGALQTVHADSNDHLAVRPGLLYSSTGQAEFGVPAGDYTVTAGRGFEYSIASTSMRVSAGELVAQELVIRREVDTHGYVACDTHVHTLTHSGHGDATVRERMITLAGEGIELPIATDHNVQIDHRPFAEEMKVSRYFTPVIGNEVTTSVGHFNIWPIENGAPLPNHRFDNWEAISDEIYRTPKVKIAILNHARDMHSGTIPFGPQMHNAVAGANLDGWPIRFNGMEVINSGATQTNVLQLCHDWMALLNAGHDVSPVGCSDSHDVGRHFVGQGRTYIRCDDRDPSQIDIDRATEAFLRGEVLVSYGLLCELTVEEKYVSGAFVQPSGDSLRVTVRVAGPHWTAASEVFLFANGEKIRSKQLDASEANASSVGTHALVNWDIELPKHDVHLVAISIGPGIDGLYWKTAKPYQPTSPDWTAHTFGCSGAVWVDGDRDGRRWSAADYARDIVAVAQGDLKHCLDSLKSYDAAVATQAAHRLQQSGLSILATETVSELALAADHVRSGFEKYQLQWRDNQIARASR